jgi:adenylate cyclase
MTATRRLAAILAADVAGYSRLMGADEEGTLERLKALRRELIEAKIAEHRGRIVKTTGDGMLLEFASVVDAVRCAVEVQQAMVGREIDVAAEQRIRFRIGINLGDVIVDGDDIHGDGVNVAARLEGLAEPGTVCVSAAAWEQVRGKVTFVAEDLGEQRLKNIEQPQRVFRVGTSASASTETIAKPPPLPDKPSIAVLPFTNMSGDPEQDYFADGVVEDIITGLSRARWLFVIARNSSFTYKGRAVDIRQVGRELRVRYVLEGSIRRAGNRIRITGQLIEAETGKHIWADRYDRDFKDIFALQDELTDTVVSVLEPTLRRVEIHRAMRRRPDNLDAYDLFLRALPEIYNGDAASIRRAQVLLERALSHDPTYSDAWTMLADCYNRLYNSGWITDFSQTESDMIQAATKAINSDPGNGSAFATASWVFATVGRHPNAIEFGRRAVELHPNSAHVRSSCGWGFLCSGEFALALQQFEAAHPLSPLDPRSFITFSGTAAVYCFQQQFEQSVYWAEKALGQMPLHLPSMRFLAASLSHLGKLEEAKLVVSRILLTDAVSSLSRFSRRRWRHEWMYDLVVAGLRQAGYPE